MKPQLPTPPDGMEWLVSLVTPNTPQVWLRMTDATHSKADICEYSASTRPQDIVSAANKALGQQARRQKEKSQYERLRDRLTAELGCKVV